MSEEKKFEELSAEERLKTARYGTRDQWVKIYGQDNVVPAPLHIGTDVLCALHLKVTGSSPIKHDLLEVACLISDADFEPYRKSQVFNLRMIRRFDDVAKSVYARRTGVSVEDLEQHASLATETYQGGANLFAEWFGPYMTTRDSKLHIIVEDAGLSQAWMRHWLGPLYEMLVRERGWRCLSSITQFHKDRAHVRHRTVESGFGRLSTILAGVGYDRALISDAPHRAAMVLKAYQKLTMFPV